MKQGNIKVYSVLILVNLLYGINFSLLKVVTPEHIKPFGFIVCRIFISFLIFGLFFLFEREKIHWRRDGKLFILCSLAGVATNQLFFFKGISLTSAINGAIIMTFSPVLVLLWSWLLIKEKISFRSILGSTLGLFGVLIIILSNSKLENIGGNWIGDVLILLNALSYTLYLVKVKSLLKVYSPFTVSTVLFGLGFLWVLPVGFQEVMLIDTSIFEINVWLSIVYVIVFSTVIVYLLNIWSLKKVSPSVVGSFIYLQPVFATLVAIFFFGEGYTWNQFLGCLLIFMGVLLSQNRPIS